MQRVSRMASAVIAAAVCGGAGLPSTQAASIVKAFNTTSLNNGGSWVGGAVPGSADVATFDNTITGPLAVSMGNSLTWGSILMSTPSGAVTINQNNQTLTLTSNGVDLSGATADLTFGGTGWVRMASNNYGSLNVAAGRTLTFNTQFVNQGNTKTATLTGAGNIIFNGSAGAGGAMSFNVTGASVFMNNASNNWASGTVSSGSLTVGNATALSNFTTTVNAADGLKFASGIASATLRNLAGTGNFALNNADANGVALAITGDNANSYSYSGQISGKGSIIKNGTSTMRFSASSSYEGGTSINGGVVELSGAAATTEHLGSGAVNLGNGAVLRLVDNTNLSQIITLSNATSVSSGAAASIALGNRALWTGSVAGAADSTLEVVAGAFDRNELRNNWSGFNGTAVFKPGSNSGIRLDAINGFSTGSMINTTLDLQGATVTVNSNSTGNTIQIGALTGTSILGGNHNSGGRVTWAIGGKNVDSTFTGSVRNGNNLTNLDKVGTGTLTLAGVNTYTGTTTVTDGTLLLADDAQLAFTIGEPSDVPTIGGTGALVLNGDFNLNLDGAPTALGTSWTLVDVDGLDALFGSTFSVIGFTESDNLWSRSIDDDTRYQFSEATGTLSVTAVPEPAAVAMLGLAGFLGLRRRRSA